MSKPKQQQPHEAGHCWTQPNAANPFSQPQRGNPFTPQATGWPQAQYNYHAPTQIGPPPQPPQQMMTPQLPQLNTAIIDANQALEVKLYWGDTILDHAHFQTPKAITIGESRRHTFTMSSDSIPKGKQGFALIDNGAVLGVGDEDTLFVHITEGMTGSLEYNGFKYPIAQLREMGLTQTTTKGFALPLYERVKLFLHMGNVTFELQATKTPPNMALPSGFQADNKLNRALGASFLLHGLVVLFMLFSDESPKTLDETFGKQNDRFTLLLRRPLEPKKEKAKKKNSGGSKAKKKEGAMGDKSAKRKDRRADQIKKNPDGSSPIDLKKTLNQKQLVNTIMRKGLMGLLPGGGAKRGSILDAKGLGGGDVNALGSWVGSKAGKGFGEGGLGLRGRGGPGGGGLSGNSVATGKPGLWGRGNGKGGRNWGKVVLKAKKQRKISISHGRTQIIGGLDRRIIRKHIHMHHKRIKYCYESELIKNKQLAGKIEVLFTISPTGRVSQAKTARSSMNNDRVEECIVRRVRNIRFPPPKGGGIVVVRYPFMFRRSGM